MMVYMWKESMKLVTKYFKHDNVIESDLPNRTGSNKFQCILSEMKTPFQFL